MVGAFVVVLVVAEGDVAATVVSTGMIVYFAVVVGPVVVGPDVEVDGTVACAAIEVELTIGATVVDDSRTELWEGLGHMAAAMTTRTTAATKI